MNMNNPYLSAYAGGSEISKIDLTITVVTSIGLGGSQFLFRLAIRFSKCPRTNTFNLTVNAPFSFEIK